MQHNQPTLWDIKSNSLRLLDDRFKVYDKIFSEKQVKAVFPKLSENLEQPDLLSIVSNTYNESEITDILIIELKRSPQNTTPACIEEQLLKYARYVNQSRNESPILIWTYSFIQFNQEVKDSLGDKSYNTKPPLSDDQIFYKYYDKNNVIIHFIDQTLWQVIPRQEPKYFGKFYQGLHNDGKLYLDMLKRTNSDERGDECYTPKQALLPLMTFLDKSKTWYEATSGQSKSIVNCMRGNGFTCIESKGDFFKQGNVYDGIVTNPPFSKKDAFIERCYAHNVPFALLLPVSSIQGIKRGSLFENLESNYWC